MNQNGKKQTTLEVIADFMNGGAWKQSEYFDDGIPVVRVTNIKNETADLSDCKFLPKSSLEKYRRHSLQTGDLVICTVGSHPTQPGSVVGRAAVIPPTAHGALLNQNAVRIRSASPDIDQGWLGYLGRSQEFHDYIISCARGSANQVRMAIGLLKEMPVNVPPHAEQRRIAGILSAYDELIENSQRRIQILETMARALYREWFIHFRYPGSEPSTRLSSHPSPRGRRDGDEGAQPEKTKITNALPDGWVVQKLKDVCQLTMGQSPKSEFYNEEGEGQPFHQGVTNFGDRFPTDRLFCTVEGRVAQAGDILFSVRAPVGRMNIADKKIIMGRGVSAIRHNGGHQPFLWEQLRNHFTKVDMMGNGAIFASVTKADMLGIDVLCPPESLIVSAEEHLTPLHNETGVLSRKIINLRQTRDLLLPRLLSGQIELEKMEDQQ